MTLTEALALAGYTHTATEHGCHDVLDARLCVAFRGRADEVWAWLHELADIQRDEEVVVIALEGCDDE